MTASASAFQVGPFKVDPTSHCIDGPDGRVSLEPKVMGVLVLLAERAGEVVTRAELVDRVWQREFGGDESLTRAISLLRKALGGQRGGGRYIETIPKSGYRLLAEPNIERDAHFATNRDRSRPRRRLGPWIGLALAVVLGIVAVFVWGRIDADRAPSSTATGEHSGPSGPVLAVLPFEYQGTGESDAHLADGLADEVLSALTRNPNVSVIAGTSSFRFRGERKDLDLLRRRLHITHLVDGTVRRAPEGLRVGVHLVDAASGLVLWSEVLERGDDAFYSIPEDVAHSILETLEADPKPASDARPPPDSRAYEAYLRARALLRDGTPDNLRRAIRLLDSAVSFDPTFAEAWAQLAVALMNVLVTRPDTEDHIDPLERRRAARQAAERALALDPDSIDAHLSLAILDYRERRLSLAEAEARFRELVERAPNHPNVNMRMGMMLTELGHLEDAYRYHRRAFDLDRFSGLTIGLYSQALYWSGRWSEAHALIWEVNRLWALAFLPICQYSTYLVEERFDASRAWLREVREAGERGGEMHLPAAELTDMLAAMISQLEREGSVSESTVQKLGAAMNERLISPYNALQIYGAIGRLDEAYDLMRERVAVGDRWFRAAPFAPGLGALRNEPRIMTVFAESGQLQYWLTTDRWPDFCNRPDLPYDCRAVGSDALELVSGD